MQQLDSEQIEFGFGLPDYTVRRSRRARHVGLRYSVRSGLEVVVPYGVRLSSAQIRELLAGGRDWIERARRRTAAARDRLPTTPLQELPLPDRLELPLLGLAWRVTTRPQDRKSVMIEELEEPGPAASGALLLRGCLSDRSLAFDVCRSFLMGESREGLGQLLADLSAEIGLNYAGVKVRSQRTRWGSCSGKGNINLNFKLCYLPSATVRSVMIHELCHTVHLNHSRDFYRLVERFDPEHRTHDRALKNPEQHLPDWLMALDLHA